MEFVAQSSSVPDSVRQKLELRGMWDPCFIANAFDSVDEFQAYEAVSLVPTPLWCVRTAELPGYQGAQAIPGLPGPHQRALGQVFRDHIICCFVCFGSVGGLAVSGARWTADRTGCLPVAQVAARRHQHVQKGRFFQPKVARDAFGLLLCDCFAYCARFLGTSRRPRGSSRPYRSPLSSGYNLRRSRRAAKGRRNCSSASCSWVQSALRTCSAALLLSLVRVSVASRQLARSVCVALGVQSSGLRPAWGFLARCALASTPCSCTKAKTTAELAGLAGGLQG